MRGLLSSDVCKICESQIPQGFWFCPACGRDRFWRIKKWEYLFGGTSLAGMFIVITSLAIFAITSLNALFAKPAPKQVQYSSLNSAPPTVILPFATATPILAIILPSVPPMSATVPTEGLIPTSDPGQFIREYFNAVWQTRNYDYLWSLSTPSFQANASTGGYQEFTSWWGSVDHVDVLSVNVTSNDGQYASVDVHVTIYLKDGRSLTNRDYPYDLIYDSNRQIWMFDYR